jgi:hypothetical protein
VSRESSPASISSLDSPGGGAELTRRVWVCPPSQTLRDRRVAVIALALDLLAALLPRMKTVRTSVSLREVQPVTCPCG